MGMGNNISSSLSLRIKGWRAACRSPKVPEWLKPGLRLRPNPGQQMDETLVFRMRKGHSIQRYQPAPSPLETAGQKIGAPWLSWHTLRRTHATLLQAAGGSIKDAQAQLGHTELSTTLEIYTLPVPDPSAVGGRKSSANGDQW